MESTGAQQLFFQHIKGLLPSNISLVDEVADILNISNDSAYRRIRGEKPIALEEIKKLCVHFKISLDQLLHLDSNSFIFSGKLIRAENFTLESYLQDFLNQIMMIYSYEDKEVYYLPKDIPIFHHFNFPELTGFKYFFWMKTVFEYPQYAKAKFNVNDLPEQLIKMGQNILEIYNKIPSQEIWNIENINNTIQQIEYYRYMNVFSSDEDAFRLYECLEKMLDHIEEQAEEGYKFNIKGKDVNPGASYKLYINDFDVGDNIVMPVVNKKPIVFLAHSFINYTFTKDPVFCEYIFDYFQRIIRKSTMVSTVSEKQRRIFFNPIRENLSKKKETLRLKIVQVTP